MTTGHPVPIWADKPAMSCPGHALQVCPASARRSHWCCDLQQQTSAISTPDRFPTAILRLFGKALGLPLAFNTYEALANLGSRSR